MGDSLLSVLSRTKCVCEIPFLVAPSSKKLIMKKQVKDAYTSIYGDDYTKVDTKNAPAVRQILSGLSNGASVKFLDDDVEVVEETFDGGNKARSFLAEINGKVSKFFVNWLASKGFPVNICEDSLEAFNEKVKEGVPEMAITNVTNANEGSVVDDWQKCQTLKEALSEIKGKECTVEAVHWTLGRFDTPDRPRITYRLNWK